MIYEPHTLCMHAYEAVHITDVEKEFMAWEYSRALLSFHKSGIKATEKMKLWTFLLFLRIARKRWTRFSFLARDGMLVGVVWWWRYKNLLELRSELKGKQINETNLLKFSFVLEIISKFQTVRTRHSPIHPIEKNIVKHIARSNYKNYLLCAWEECPEKWFMFFLSHSTVGTFGCCRVTRYPQRARNITRRERFEWGRQRSINVSGNWCAGAKVSVHNYTMLQPLGSARKLMILFHSVAFSGSGKMGKTL